MQKLIQKTISLFALVGLVISIITPCSSPKGNDPIEFDDDYLFLEIVSAGSEIPIHLI